MDIEISMRELDQSEINALVQLYERTKTRAQFVIEADHKMGDVPKAMLGAIWDAIDRALDVHAPR